MRSQSALKKKAELGILLIGALNVPGHTGVVDEPKEGCPGPVPKSHRITRNVYIDPCSMVLPTQEVYESPGDYQRTIQVQDLSVCMCKQDSISVQPRKDQLQVGEYLSNHFQATGQAEQWMLSVCVS